MKFPYHAYRSANLHSTYFAYNSRSSGAVLTSVEGECLQTFIGTLMLSHIMPARPCSLKPRTVVIVLWDEKCAAAMTSGGETAERPEEYHTVG